MRELKLAERQSIRKTAMLLAEAARKETLGLFRSPGLVSNNKLKDGFDPVTEADKAAERAMRALLQVHRPEDAIIGEEYGRSEGTSGLTWVLDPIDGTRGFLSGTPTWGVLIGLCDGTRPVFGVIDQPYIGERFIGGFGDSHVVGPQGTTDLKARPPRSLADSILFTTFPEVGGPAEGAAFRRVAERVRLTRYGMDCYAYALIAAGQVDLVIEAGLNVYDIAAPIAVVEAAGGIVTNWQGGSADEGGQVIAAANAEVHAEALILLNDTKL